MQINSQQLILPQLKLVEFDYEYLLQRGQAIGPRFGVIRLSVLLRLHPLCHVVASTPTGKEIRDKETF